jgi:hypothetical protein
VVTGVHRLGQDEVAAGWHAKEVLPTGNENPAGLIMNALNIQDTKSVKSLMQSTLCDGMDREAR